MPVRRKDESGQLINGLDPLSTDYAIPAFSSFSSYLISDPIYFHKDFGLHFRGISVVYDLEAVMALEEDSPVLFADKIKSIKEEGRLRNKDTKAFRAKWQSFFDRTTANNKDYMERLNELLGVLTVDDDPYLKLVAAKKYLSTLDEELTEVTEQETEEYQEAFEEYKLSLREHSKRLVELNTELGLAIIRYIVLEINWPFEGEGPNQDDPASFEVFGKTKDRVIYWISTAALVEVKKQLTGPLFTSPSSATSTN